ncbi:hypothetical protein EDB86DRAFT_830420 [Lactarius hatsudake]|nr:hypothetical protein EDB86DRAFT_830420 [Lactarius hatsudake]
MVIFKSLVAMTMNTPPVLAWSTVIHRGEGDRSNWSATTDILVCGTHPRPVLTSVTTDNASNPLMATLAQKLKHDLCAKRTGNNPIEWIFSEWSGEAGGRFLFLLGEAAGSHAVRRSQDRFDRCFLYAVLYLTAQNKKSEGSTCEIRGRPGANWTARLLATSMAFPSSVHDPRICHRDATPQKQKKSRTKDAPEAVRVRRGQL